MTDIGCRTAVCRGIDAALVPLRLAPSRRTFGVRTSILASSAVRAYARPPSTAIGCVQGIYEVLHFHRARETWQRLGAAANRLNKVIEKPRDGNMLSPHREV